MKDLSKILVGRWAVAMCAGWISLSPALAQQLDLHAIVESNGGVALCLVRTEILFPDRCMGAGRLIIVQPIKEGPVAWRSVVGTVVMEETESPQNPDCALSRAKWDPLMEQTTATGKRIENIDPVAVLAQLDQQLAEPFTEEDVTAFSIDLDNDGSEEVVFVASNVTRIAKLNEKTGQPYLYQVRAGVLQKGSRHPAAFYVEGGTYEGGTDAIGGVEIKGVAPIALRTGEIALLVRVGTGMDGDQELVRYRQGRTQRIQTFEFRCN